MDDAIDPLQLADVVSPTLQTTEREINRLDVVPSKVMIPLSVSSSSQRSPSCGPPRIRGQRTETSSSVLVQRHKSTPSRRKRPATFEPVASPLRLVSTQRPDLLTRLEEEGLSDPLDYATIIQKKESLRKLLSELATSPQATMSTLSPLGRSSTSALKVSPVKGELPAVKPVVNSEPLKVSIALSPLSMEEASTALERTDIDSYLKRIAELEEKLMQREAEMKELMVAVLSDVLSKESLKDKEITNLTEKLKHKEDELLQVLELVSTEQAQRENKCSVSIQTRTMPSQNQTRTKPNAWKGADSRKIADAFCPQCRKQAELLFSELKEVTNETIKRATADQPDISGNIAKKPLKKVSKASTKDTLVYSKSAPARNIKEIEEQHQKETTFIDQSLSQFMLSPEVSVAAPSDSCMSIASTVLDHTTTTMTQRFVNTSVSTMSELISTPDVHSKLGREGNTEDPLFNTVFDILTEVAK